MTSSDRFSWIRRAVTFALVCVGWALFRATDIGQGWNFIQAMLWPRGVAIPLALREIATRQRIVYLALGLLVVLLPARSRAGRLISDGEGRRAEVLRYAVLFTAAPVACLYALSSSFSPFLYFKF